MTDDVKAFDKKQLCGMTWEEWANSTANVVIETTKGNIMAIRRAAELEPSIDGKAALTTVANILEKNNK